MATDKTRITIYLADRRPLDDLAETLRTLAPIEARGAISRSTCIEAAVSLALADLRTNGRRSSIYESMVTSLSEVRRNDPYHTPCTQHPTHPLQAVSFASEDFATALEALPNGEQAG